MSGRAWVAAQLGLIVLALASGLRAPGRPGRARAALAGVAAGAGGALVAGGARSLGDALSPLPEPVPGADLRQEGAYASVRHPIYGGLAFLALAWTLARGRRTLPASLALVAFLDRKARHEEALLAARHPAYAGYRRRVPRRLVPKRRGAGMIPAPRPGN